MNAVEALSESVSDWAQYQNLAGECDTVERCPVTGNYNWRSYIQEEAEFARRRDVHAKPREKKDLVEPTTAPAGYYA